MLKKFTALLFSTTAYAIILAHSIIPHHHHDSDHELAAPQQFHQEHDDSHDDVLNHLFAHFVHTGDEITFTTSQNFTGSFSKQCSLSPAVLSGNFSLIPVSPPPLLFSPPEQQVVYTSPHSLASGLRAPPAFVI